jgi:hypothetical protein
MGPVAVIAGIGLAISAGSAYMTHKAQKKAAKMQKRAAAAQRAQDNMRAARERREAIRNARIASASVAQGAANEGVFGASGTLGGLGSIQSQLNQNLSFLDGQNRLADQASVALGKANEANMKAQTWNSVGNFGMAMFSNASGIAGTFGGGSKGG